METTPIEVLEHHVEKLEMAKKCGEIDKNMAYVDLKSAEISKFKKAIIELKNIELK